MRDAVDATTNSSRSCSVSYFSNKSCQQAIDAGRYQQGTDTGRCQQDIDTGRCQQDIDTGRCQQVTDTGRCQQDTDTGRCQQATDTGRCQQATEATDTARCQQVTDTGRCQQTTEATDTGRCQQIMDTGRCQQGMDTGRCQQVMDTGRCQQVMDTARCQQATLMSCCCSVSLEAEAEPFYQQIESSPKRYLNIDLYACMRWRCVGCDGRSSSRECSGSRQLSQGRPRIKHCPASYLSDVIIWALILSFLARGISASYIGSRTDATFNYSSLEHRSSGHPNDMGGAPRNFSTIFRHKNRTDPMKNRTDPMKNEHPMKDEVMHSSPDKADLNQDLLSSPQVSKSDDGFVAASGTKSDSKQAANIKVEPAHLTATEPHHDDHSSGDEDNTNKIIGLVVPFVCVILLAVVLCVSWRLCRRYKLCRNEACLEKCSLFCNNCMSAPLVFQAAEQVKFQSQVSRTTTTSMAPILKHSRSSASPSSVSLSTAGVSRQPQSSRTSIPRRSNDPSRASRHSHASAHSGVSRHGSSGSSRHSTGYSPVGQKNLVHAVSV